MMGLLLSACWLMAGCSTIDDDLSNCEEEGKQFKTDYQLKLVTNMTTELKTQLTTITELSVAGALETHLKNIFTIMDANQSSYTLTLPMRKYMHLAVANIIDNSVVDLANDQSGITSSLRQAVPTVPDGSFVGVLPSHTTGLFTARQPMEVLENVDQTFNVHLYMANCAATLVLDPKGQHYTDLKVYATGFANDFLIKDSTYVYESTSTLIEAEKVETGNNLLCFCSVNFPSRDATPAAVKKRAGTGPVLWQFKIYLTKSDGKITETVLDIEEPLKAGDLRIIKGELDDDGAVRPYDSTVGVSVTLDWEDGGEYNPSL